MCIVYYYIGLCTLIFYRHLYHSRRFSILPDPHTFISNPTASHLSLYFFFFFHILRSVVRVHVHVHLHLHLHFHLRVYLYVCVSIQTIERVMCRASHQSKSVHIARKERKNTQPIHKNIFQSFCCFLEANILAIVKTKRFLFASVLSFITTHYHYDCILNLGWILFCMFLSHKWPLVNFLRLSSSD